MQWQASTQRPNTCKKLGRLVLYHERGINKLLLDFGGIKTIISFLQQEQIGKLNFKGFINNRFCRLTIWHLESLIDQITENTINKTLEANMQSGVHRYKENSFRPEFRVSLETSQKVNLGHIAENLLRKAGGSLIFYLVKWKPVKMNVFLY